MNLFGFNIQRAKAAPKTETRPQFSPNSAQGPLTPYFRDYYLRKVSGEFYEALREGIPIIDAAIRRLISLNGTIRIIGDNAPLVRELEDFCLNVPVNDTQKGIHAFLENASNETFEQGFSLSEFVATQDLKDIAGLRVADSKNIFYRRNAEGRAEPWYRHSDTPNSRRLYSSPATVVENILTAQYGTSLLIGGLWEEKLNPANKLYFSINNENTDPYGVSLMRSMEFCAQILTTMQNSVKNVWERFGDPSFHVKYGLTKRSLGSDDLEARRQKIATDFSAAVRAKRAGKSADFVSALNADDTMEIKVIGADGQVLEMEVPVRHVLEQLVGKTGLPAWMLGIYWSTTERMATLEVESILQDAKIRQLSMTPEFIRLFSTVLRLRGRTWKNITLDPDKPGDWGFVFETPNLRDLVAQAQARFLNAQADQMGSAAETISVAGPPKKGVGHPSAKGCGCGKDHIPGVGKTIRGVKEVERPQPWPELDAVEAGYEARLKADWEDVRQAVFRAGKITPADIALSMGQRAAREKMLTPDQRAQIMVALSSMIGEYVLDGEDSPVNWYYGQAFSLGAIQAANLVGEERPEIDIIRNSETFEKLAQEGFERVRDNATKAIVDKILPEMEAMVIAGSNPNEIAERLRKLFDQQNGNWERLARSEISMAAEKAKLEEWTARGVAMVEFTPAPDACPICVALAGDYEISACPVPVEDTHPYCRCSIRPAASEA